MQQQMNQPEPIGGQQAVQQQMVLCPVRFVYETQVLVQPGDQIQPNQTFFINPQNPPPWMQNRPAPNPVVYVQQLPNNMLQSVQQPMDQNQLYLQQNFANFQLQQHMLAQNHQEMRPMQLANIVPNMVQNVQQSIQSNERNINQNPNTGQMQANTQNMIQNQMTVARQVPNQGNQTVEVQRQVQFMNVRPQMGQQMNIARPMMSLNQLQNMQAMANMQNLQIQQANAGQTFVQTLGQRMPQNVNAVRPQIMPNTALNVQNANNSKPPPQEANKAMTNVGTPAAPNVRNFAQNYNCRPIQPRRRFTENNANVPKMQQQNMPVQQQKMQQQQQNIQQQQNMQQQQNQQQHIPVPQNTQQQQHIPVSQNTQQQQNQQQHIPVSLNTQQQQNQQQHIPVSQNTQQQQNQQQHIPVPQNMQQQPNQQQHIPVQHPPTQQQHQYNQDKVNSHQMVANIAANTAYLNNQNISRKRKSESPDEIQNKMAVPSATQHFYKNHQQGIIVTKLCEMGTNTSPVHKSKLNVGNANNQALQINQSTPMVIENAEQIKQDGNQIKTETRTVIVSAPSENDKLIRNTVFGQARGRLLQDKISENLPQVIENKPPESVQNTNDNKTTPEAETDKDTVMTEVPTDKLITVTIQSEGATVTKTQPDSIESRIIQILESIPKNKNTQTIEDKPAKLKKTEVIKEIKVENVKCAEHNVSNENNASQSISIEATTKNEPQETLEVKEQSSEIKDEKVEATEKVVSKQDILTHVVDGYVIQESNFAFPIRKPLIEKTLQANPKAESESIDALKECMKEEMKNTAVDVQLLPFHYLLLHCEKKKEEEEMENSKKLDPFTDLLQSTVKSWTIRKLQSQITKPQTSIRKVSAPTKFKKGRVDKKESRTEEPVPPTEVKEEKIDQEEKTTTEPASDTEVKDEIVDQEESATVEPVPLNELLIEIKEKETEETVPPTEVKQETVDQEENITTEPVTSIEVKDEEIDFKEENITEKPVPPTEVKEEIKEVPNGESNPFARLQQSTVRSWTVEDLSNHLQKFNWEETAAFLEDNEIDGAALFMVTKGQLMIIGINEEQAEVICEFLQSGSSRGN